MLHPFDRLSVLSPGRLFEGPSQLHCSHRFAITPCPCILNRLPPCDLYSCSEDGHSFFQNFMMICHIMRHDIWEDINLINSHSLHSGVNEFSV